MPEGSVPAEVADLTCELEFLLNDVLDRAYEIMRDAGYGPGKIILPKREQVRLAVMFERKDRQDDLVCPAYREAAEALWELITKFRDFETIRTIEGMIRRKQTVSTRMVIDVPTPEFTEKDLKFMQAVSRGR